MRARELPLVLLALVLCQASPGPAAPVPAGGGTVLDKMYPRGNHWAVGLPVQVLNVKEGPPAEVMVMVGSSLKEAKQNP